MACITLFAPPMAMATTQLARAVHYEAASQQFDGSVPRNSLRMSWVVVTDNNGNRTLRMQWASDEDC
jgi:hypothetical protein